LSQPSHLATRLLICFHRSCRPFILSLAGRISFFVKGAAMAANFGRFKGQVIALWLDDGRNMQTTQRFAYIDAKGKEWVAPANSVVNGASIPASLWSVVGGPYEGQYRNASVVHDVYC